MEVVWQLSSVSAMLSLDPVQFSGTSNLLDPVPDSNSASEFLTFLISLDLLCCWQGSLKCDLFLQIFFLDPYQGLMYSQLLPPKDELTVKFDATH